MIFRSGAISSSSHLLYPISTPTFALQLNVMRLFTAIGAQPSNSFFCVLAVRTYSSSTSASLPAPSTMRIVRETPISAALRFEFARRRRTHPFMIAEYSEYTLLLAVALFGFLVATVQYLHAGFLGAAADVAALLLGAVAFTWAGDMRTLGNNAPLYTPVVRRNLLLGVALFIVSEVMIFAGMFWSFFHSSLNPTGELGAVWPPAGLEVLEWQCWPSMSTLLLVYSGFAVNVFYYRLKALGVRRSLTSALAATAAAAAPVAAGAAAFAPTGAVATAPALRRAVAAAATPAERLVEALRGRSVIAAAQPLYGGMLYTLVAGGLFVCCQSYEYAHAAFSMADGVYGTVFYGLTGLHGAHVIAGLLLLALAQLRLSGGDAARDNTPHVGVTAAVWYWHFVDIVWIALFLAVYLWGNAGTSATELLASNADSAQQAALAGAVFAPFTGEGGGGGEAPADEQAEAGAENVTPLYRLRYASLEAYLAEKEAGELLTFFKEVRLQQARFRQALMTKVEESPNGHYQPTTEEWAEWNRLRDRVEAILMAGYYNPTFRKSAAEVDAEYLARGENFVKGTIENCYSTLTEFDLVVVRALHQMHQHQERVKALAEDAAADAAAESAANSKGDGSALAPFTPVSPATLTNTGDNAVGDSAVGDSGAGDSGAGDSGEGTEGGSGNTASSASSAGPETTALRDGAVASEAAEAAPPVAAAAGGRSPMVLPRVQLPVTKPLEQYWKMPTLPDFRGYRDEIFAVWASARIFHTQACHEKLVRALQKGDAHSAQQATVQYDDAVNALRRDWSSLPEATRNFGNIETWVRELPSSEEVRAAVRHARLQQGWEGGRSLFELLIFCSNPPTEDKPADGGPCVRLLVRSIQLRSRQKELRDALREGSEDSIVRASAGYDEVITDVRQTAKRFPGDHPLRRRIEDWLEEAPSSTELTELVRESAVPAGGKLPAPGAEAGKGSDGSNGFDGSNGSGGFGGNAGNGRPQESGGVEKTEDAGEPGGNTSSSAMGDSQEGLPALQDGASARSSSPSALSTAYVSPPAPPAVSPASQPTSCTLAEALQGATAEGSTAAADELPSAGATAFFALLLTLVMAGVAYVLQRFFSGAFASVDRGWGLYLGQRWDAVTVFGNTALRTAVVLCATAVGFLFSFVVRLWGTWKRRL